MDLNKTKIAIVLMTMVVQPLLILCSPSVASTPSPTHWKQLFNYLSHSFTPQRESKCSLGWNLSEVNDEPSCFKYFPSLLSFDEAVQACIVVESYIATVENKQELDFLMENQWTDSSHGGMWIGYQYIWQPNTTSWLVSRMTTTRQYLDSEQRSYMLNEELIMPTNTSSQTLCIQIETNRNGVVPTNCTNKTSYLCRKDAIVTYTCTDRKQNSVVEGGLFTPEGSDICTKCRCHGGQPTMCMSPMCGKPSCINYIRDDEECCMYHCVWDDLNNENKNLVGIESNMQWMLTMAFSFFILGVVLIMIYRMRQKRMAYLRFRRERLQQLSQMDFEPGSGPPPPPDDFDGAGFQEPPPPYTFYKDENGDLPPPYEPLTIAMPTVNANNRKTEDTGETVTLLGDSEPSTPSIHSADLTMSEVSCAITMMTSDGQLMDREEEDGLILGVQVASSIAVTLTGSEMSEESNSSIRPVYQTAV